MSEARVFAFGDRVVHEDRPEWGVGRVLSVEPCSHNGAQGQRVRVRFSRGGLKTLTTPPAKLAPATQEGEGFTDRLGSEGGWLEQISQKSPEEVFSALPEAATDPFASPEARLKATFDLYRFSPQGASLIDWAVAQSGLADPLSRYSRHELEAFFKRFERAREAHLTELLAQLKKRSPEKLRQVVSGASPSARAAAQRILARL
ncbi:MAG: DUF3553 domain-containing protein [Planctomycetota bacterium]|nr:MAG: DUF3553 domain-containing protein [Planctomycetota bacterium]